MDGLEAKSVVIQRWPNIHCVPYEMTVVVAFELPLRSNVEQLICWQATIGTMRSANIMRLHQVVTFATFGTAAL